MNEVSFPEMVQGEKGLLVSLRCENFFDEKIYAGIMQYLRGHLEPWKAEGKIPVPDVVALFDLIDELSGGSRFWSEEVTLRVEDAVLEIQDLIHGLEASNRI